MRNEKYLRIEKRKIFPVRIRMLTLKFIILTQTTDEKREIFKDRKEENISSSNSDAYAEIYNFSASNRIRTCVGRPLPVSNRTQLTTMRCLQLHLVRKSLSVFNKKR